MRLVNPACNARPFPLRFGSWSIRLHSTEPNDESGANVDASVSHYWSWMHLCVTESILSFLFCGLENVEGESSTIYGHCATVGTEITGVMTKKKNKKCIKCKNILYSVIINTMHVEGCFTSLRERWCLWEPQWFSSILAVHTPHHQEFHLPRVTQTVESSPLLLKPSCKHNNAY